MVRQQKTINVVINIDFYKLDLWTFLGGGGGGGGRLRDVSGYKIDL